MSEPCLFDDGLPRMIRVLTSRLGIEAVQSGVFVRDITGSLSFVARHKLDDLTFEQIATELTAELAYYARPDRVIAKANESGAQRLLQDPAALRIDAGGPGAPLWIHMIDRRIVGADWLRPPTEPPATDVQGAAPAQRVLFFSMKGGVGRSTALSVAAIEQARQGRNVLVLDLDLEAPGIGSLLLSDDRMPTYGAIDYLVERNFWQDSASVQADYLVQNMVGTSVLTSGAGLINLVPAMGSRTLQEPRNYLAKLARAVIEGHGSDEPVPLSTKLNDLLSALEAQQRYDFVFIDVRAGLAELTAGPLLALNAEALIFGTAQPQTIQDLTLLFSHLSMLTAGAQPTPWAKLKMVHAKATTPDKIKRFRDDIWDLFATYFYEEAEGLDSFNFDADSPEAPHFPIAIPLDTAFADWDPIHNPDSLLSTYYDRSFRDLNKYINDLLIGEPDGEDE